MPPSWKCSHVKMSFPVCFWLLYHVSYSNHFTAAISTPKGLNWLQLLTIVTIISLFTDRIIRAQRLCHKASFSAGLSGYPSCIVKILLFHLTSFSTNIVISDNFITQIATSVIVPTSKPGCINSWRDSVAPELNENAT